MLFGRRQRVQYVVEVHDKWPCTCCNVKQWAKAIWLAPLWVSGADPVGPPSFVICDECFELADIGALVA